MKKLVVILLSFVCLSFNYSHKYYVALTEIEHNGKSKSIQMIMNVFIDDIELAINTDYDVDLKLTTKNEAKNTDKLFYKYLNNHLVLKVNDELKNFKYIGKEYDGDIVFFYLEVENIEELKSIHIKNDMLVKYFPEQQNLIKVTVDDQRKSLFLNRKNDKGLLKF